MGWRTTAGRMRAAFRSSCRWHCSPGSSAARASSSVHREPCSGSCSPCSLRWRVLAATGRSIPRTSGRPERQRFRGSSSRVDGDLRRVPKGKPRRRGVWSNGTLQIAHPDSEFRAAAAAITAAGTYEEAVDRSAEHCANALATCCVISLLSEEGEMLYPIGLSAPDPGVVEALDPIVGVPLPSDRGFAGRALAEGAAVVADRITADDLRKMGSGYSATAERFGVGAVFALPLKTRKTVLGTVVCLSPPAAGPFSEADVGFVSDVAAVLALRVEADLLAEAPRPAAGVTPPSASPSDAAASEILTTRERQILGLLALGYMNKEIGARISLSVRTVEWHRARIQWKLGVYSRAEIVKVASDLGLTRGAE